VTHPPPVSEMPSIIASVATTDGNRNQFNSELGAQYNRDVNRKSQEAILDGEAIYTRHLKAWQDRNSQRLPSSIIVFRDGVSEGEYQHVSNLEVDCLKKVGAKVSLDWMNLNG
jgi:eukaryotic translation initiation factor 2C